MDGEPSHTEPLVGVATVDVVGSSTVVAQWTIIGRSTRVGLLWVEKVATLVVDDMTGHDGTEPHDNWLQESDGDRQQPHISLLAARMVLPASL